MFAYRKCKGTEKFCHETRESWRASWRKGRSRRWQRRL